MKAPRLLGFPLWLNNKKKRKVKKIIKYWSSWKEYFNKDVKVVEDCRGQKLKIAIKNPRYYHNELVYIDLEDSVGFCCSLKHCCDPWRE